MNLHAVVRSAINTVNPDRAGMLQISAGSTTGPDGTRSPTYKPAIPVRIQVQDVTSPSLRQNAGLLQQGNSSNLYLYGDVQGVSRADNQGGDIVTIGTDVFLVTAVLETWPGWCKVCCTRQMGAN